MSYISGTAIGLVTVGGYTNQLGETDICVFGDGSMVSAWSLIYMANNQPDYVKVKNAVRAASLDILIPK